jgi:uncharacterized membrane protein YeaQ/YmgE (transglycosylase-associated protein family)
VTSPFDGLILDPGGTLAWLAVGLISGWLAGSFVGSGGYGIVGDIVVGLIGAVAGGFLFGFFVQGTEGFWGSVVVAFLGASILIALGRVLTSSGKRA